MSRLEPPFLAALGLTPASPIHWDLLTKALSPPQAQGGPDNDRLEFIGDEVVRLVATRFVYEKYPDLPVGELTSLRAQLVSNQALAHWAKTIQLGLCLPAGLSKKQLANALEAVLGALYLSTVDAQDPNSGDLRWITPWLYPLFTALAQQVLADPARFNHKAALQEWSQHYLRELPDYRLTQISPVFAYAVYLGDQCRGVGTGLSKKKAQEQAAQQAYQELPPLLQRLSTPLSPEQQTCLQHYLA